MSRDLFSDKLQTYQFHLIDVDPSFSLPPWVLIPSAGFSAITMPEVTIETQEVKEGTDPFVHHVLDKASTNTITLSKGASTFNSDFWRWTMGCLAGNPPAKMGSAAEFFTNLIPTKYPPIPGKRRNMILMHLTGMSFDGLKEAIKFASGVDAAKAALLMGTSGWVSGASEGLKTMTGGMIDFGISSVVGKVYLLIDCLPSRYKPGTDFDADSSDISIEELDLTYHRFEECSLFG